MAGGNCLRFSPLDGAARAHILLLPPFFDEANRMRRTLVHTMRTLSLMGIDSHLPDLPGQNDDLLATSAVTLDGWRSAVAQYAATIEHPFVTAAWRGGALVDDAAATAVGHWRMAPVGGASILKTMVRTRIASEREAGRTISAADVRALAERNGHVELAGNRLSLAMFDGLEQAQCADIQPLRLVSPAEMAGSALWLRAEPGEDMAMAATMAQDLADWAVQCAVG